MLVNMNYNTELMINYLNDIKEVVLKKKCYKSKQNKGHCISR